MAKPIEKINLQPSHVAAYRFVEKYRKNKFFSPEIKEVAKGVGVTERQGYRIIDDLVALGYMTREKRKKRSIQIVRPLR